ncbi:hypothetical protein AB4Z21_31620, partial [Paenibacillus sp. MCAF20]
MKRRSARALLLVAILSAATLLGACSDKESQPIVTEEEKQSVIRFVAAEYSTESKPFLEKLVREFEIQNPEIIVDLQVANWNVLDGIYT